LQDAKRHVSPSETEEAQFNRRWFNGPWVSPGKQGKRMKKEEFGPPQGGE